MGLSRGKMACSIEEECRISEPYFAEYFFVMSSTWSNELFHTKTRVFTLGRNASLAFPELTVPQDTQGSFLGSPLPALREEDSWEV